MGRRNVETRPDATTASEERGGATPEHGATARRAPDRPAERSAHPARIRVFTIGHSNHPLDRFVELLGAHGVTRVLDVRRFPGSRRQPHFGGEALARSLPAQGIDIRHLVDLGGRRRPRPGSPNGGWRVEAFRAYADHMASPGFRAALRDLEALAGERRSAIMCAEGLWWRCHRRLVSDALVVRGWEVRHIAPDGREAAHQLTGFAEVRGAELVYPPVELDLGV